MAETKPKAADSLRKPEPKKSLGLKPPTLRSYHDDLIRAEISPAAKPSTLPSQTSQASLTRQSSQTSQSQKIAPERDFSKVPNSIAREVVPSGEFKGKSKQLYDCLYHLTRGAIVPRKAVRISRPQLMKKAGIGSRVTFDTNVSHLKAIGLLEVKPIAGEHEGNEYTIHLPEERSLTSQTTLTSQTSHAQDQDRLVGLESSQTRQSLSVDSTNTSGEVKTSFKTKERSDDEPAALADVVRQLERELTGKNSAKGDQWRELGEVLAAELRIAAARTTVSNVPAFLAEHLRRRLWKLDKKQARAEGRELPDEAASSPPAPEAAGCPDCSGTGWWYPQGPEKGVAKCRHRQAD